jgi:biopolymer transport protein TolR
MAGGNGGNGIISGINVTPLVDITLVLLIVFIVTARIMVTPAVPVDLPQASQSEEIQAIFAVTVPVSGPIFVNGTAVPDDGALVRLARAAVTANADLRAVIDADGSAPYRRVIHALDVLKRAGVKRVAFGAMPDEDAKQ